VQTRIFLENDKTVVETVQDVEDILEHNKALRSEKQAGDWGRHVASIPNVIMVRWLNEEWARGNTTIRLFGPEMDALVERKLKDPEWKFLRTDSAQVQGFMGFGS
jgi:hypothetical protein